MTIFTFILFLILLISESYEAFVKVQRKEHVVVDSSLGEKLRINMNITFPALTCVDVNLDAMDVAGDNQMHIDHTITKQRLNKKGERIGEPFREDVTKQAVAAMPKDYCGSCYGAGEKGECCNTCEQVVTLYTAKGWNINYIR